MINYMKVTVLASKTRCTNSNVFEFSVFFKNLKIATCKEEIYDDDMDTLILSPKMTVDTWNYYRDELRDKVLPKLIDIMSEHESLNNNFTGVFYETLKEDYE